MLTCPVCESPNEDGSVSCEHCNCLLQALPEETLLAAKEQPADATVIASGFSAEHTERTPRVFSSELPIGHILVRRYEVLERLGQGGMGTVYKVQDLELDRVVALKTIRPDLASNASALRRLKQETLLTRQIAHRNVIRVFDLGVSEGLRFITMEFVEGNDLKSVLELKKKLPVDKALEILTQIVQGLVAAHGEDVVHRDLKPQNILLSNDGRVRIVDFGLARSFADTGITHTGTILGTPTYMAPEQALGKQGDVRSDIFSFGVIAFEMLSGALPYPNQTLSESLLSRTRGQARPIEDFAPETPAWLARIVMRCLEREPQNRYATAGDLEADLLAREVCPFSVTPLSATSLAPGTMIGTRYRIEADAGEGGMGKVYRALDLELQRTVALKVVKPELANNSGILDQLKHEISIASQISHKNVLRVHDMGETSGLRYVSMAWADGEDLASLLKRTGPLPEEQVVTFGVEICEGLEAAHEQGVSHRDLKPSNVLLTQGGHACIADFGLAHSLQLPKEASGATTPSTSGTPRYMSPEQVDGVDIDHRTDIYSLGLILYEMATGRIPFNDESTIQTMTQRITERPASPRVMNPSVSEHLAKVILKCLEREPKLRYESVSALLTDLRNKPVLPSLQRKSRLFPWLLASAVALIVGIVTITLWHRPTVTATPPINGKYIAVLPFRAVGGDPNLKYRAEGIAEAIGSRLASLSSLHPVSSSAVERVNLAQSEEAIGKQLGANLLVRGTVQGEGDRLKVDAQIFNTEKKQTIWSNSYQGVTGDLFTLEDEIASDAEGALDIKRTGEERQRTPLPPTQNLAAYDLYLKGRDTLKKNRNVDGAKKALSLFEQACKQDDSFALAWAGVADANLFLYRLTKDSLYASKAALAAQNARHRNDNLPEVHFSLGSVYTATGRNTEAVSEIKQALQLAPNSDDGYLRLGRAYLATGKRQEGLEALRKAVSLNPYYWYNHYTLGSAYFRLGMTDDSLREFKEQAAQNPESEDGFNNVGSAYLQAAQWKKAIPEFEKAIKIKPSLEAYSNLATAYYHSGRYKEAIPVYEEAVQLDPNQPETIRNLAEAYARTGQDQKAKEAFNRAIGLLYGQLDVNPQNAEAFGTLAMCFAGQKEFAKARQNIQHARQINPADSDLMYDEASIEALDGKVEPALVALKNALENGLPFAFCESDPDLKAVRGSPGFAALKRKFGHQ
jgi:eukaryotic-like serine/threonine-protein kinase